MARQDSNQDPSQNNGTKWLPAEASDFRLDADEVHIWAVSSLNTQSDRRYWDVLSDAEIERAQRFLRDQDRNRFVGRRAALRLLLANYEHRKPHLIRFASNQYGKPSSVGSDRYTDLQFSSTSSADFAMIAFTASHHVGIDIESMDREVDMLALSSRFFHPREAEDIKTQPSTSQRRTFFNCWTRKEAYVKAVGRGLYLPLDSFQVSVLDDEPKLIWTDNSTIDNTDWAMRSCTPHSDYVGALVFPSVCTSISCFRFDNLATRRD